jgi:hypothetical protein
VFLWTQPPFLLIPIQIATCPQLVPSFLCCCRSHFRTTLTVSAQILAAGVPGSGAMVLPGLMRAAAALA